MIDTEDVTADNVARIINRASVFFSRYTDYENIEVVENDQSGYDIEINGIEVGSYGIRSCEYLKWIYATGCAEPRLTYAVNLK